MRLAEAQEAFAQALLERHVDAVAPLIATGEMTVEERLAIYRVNVFENLADALADTFPATQALVGEEFFHALAVDYVRHTPPQVACLLWYGDDFPDFIAGYERAASVPYLADVARLEWAWQSALFAEDDEALDPAWLEAQEEAALEVLVFTLREGAGLVASSFPLYDIWQFALKPEEVPPPDMESAGERLAIWRDGREMRVKPLSEAEYAALAILAKGATLGQAIAAASQQENELDPTGLLGTLFGLHILSHPSTIASNLKKDRS